MALWGLVLGLGDLIASKHLSTTCNKPGKVVNSQPGYMMQHDATLQD